jgi:hypothetical protein
MPPAGLEPAIPASERPQTHALDRAATGMGTHSEYAILFQGFSTATMVWRKRLSVTFVRKYIACRV